MLQDLKLEANEYRTLADTVFKRLRWAILNGELTPGERLIETFLAEQFKVSRTPVREAIRKLELEGLVLSMPGRGAKVAKISEKDLKDVLEIRAFLEKNAIDLACERINIEWIMKFETILEKLHCAISSREITKIVESDVCFHKLIFEITGNIQLVQVMNNLEIHMYRYRFEYLKELSNYMQLYKAYYSIYEAIKEHDKKLAQKLMNDHIYCQKQVLIKKCNS